MRSFSLNSPTLVTKCDVIANASNTHAEPHRMDNIVTESFFNFIFLKKARVQVASRHATTQCILKWAES